MHPGNRLPAGRCQVKHVRTTDLDTALTVAPVSNEARNASP